MCLNQVGSGRDKPDQTHKSLKYKTMIERLSKLVSLVHLLFSDDD